MVGARGMGSIRLPGGKTAVAGDVGVGGVAARMWRPWQLAESPTKMGSGVGDEGGGRGLLLDGEGNVAQTSGPGGRTERPYARPSSAPDSP